MKTHALALLTLLVISCTSAPAPQAPVSQQTRLPEPAAVRAQLAARRTVHLGRLLAYADAGVFPANDVRPGPLNVFIDRAGHLCAAANLMALDGQRALVVAAASDDNFVVLGNVKSGALYDWMLASGFTQEEIAMIQEPYMFEPDPQAEQQRLQGVLRGVHAVLQANTDKSLDLAVARLTARPDLVASL
jgi:hypothetical protein